MINVTRVERQLIAAIAANDGPLDWDALSGPGMTAANKLHAKKGLVQINMILPWTVELSERGKEWWAQHCDD